MTLGLTNVTHSIAGYAVATTNPLGGVTTYQYDSYSRKVKTTNIANGRELKRVTTYHDSGSLATSGQITETGTNTTSYSSRQAVAGKPEAYKIVVTDALKNATTNYYSGSGQHWRSEGATYPVGSKNASASKSDGESMPTGLKGVSTEW